MPELQDRIISMFSRLGKGRLLTRDRWPDWLQRPGRHECGARWGLVCDIYSALTGGSVLPECMPPREFRSVDGAFQDANGRWRFVECDESQHFNAYRAMTLRLYPADIQLGFPKPIWIDRSLVGRRLAGGGFAKPKPPLFPQQGGRHLQRAFRDALADLLPSLYNFAPTVRIGHFEVEPWIWQDGAESRLGELLTDRML